jgi:glycosyltransferase involved in cell wall biosynthesis
MKVLGISNCFPREKRPDFGVFAYELYLEMVRQGVKMSVIAPYSFLRSIKEHFLFGCSDGVNYQKEYPFEVIRPNLLNVPLTIFGNTSIMKYNLRSLCKTIKSSSKKTFSPDWISAYFFDSAVAALSAYMNVPVYVEIGESNFLFYEQFLTKEEIKSYLKRCAGIIAVSQGNFKIIRDRYGISENLYLLENGVNTERFVPVDKNIARKQLGLPVDDFIIIFVGGFIERKGPLRVLRAVEKVRGIKAIFIGRGPQIPSGDRVLMACPMPNENLPTILSACDAFVLPSLAEGLSVAILEAAACGLPLIISDKDFNRAFIDDESALFVDPCCVDDIARAISMLNRDKDLRNSLSQKSRRIAESHSLKERVKKLFELVENNRL